MQGKKQPTNDRNNNFTLEVILSQEIEMFSLKFKELMEWDMNSSRIETM